jgi:MarR family transcriptional regulator, transcriptional regulator for hemolysin
MNIPPIDPARGFPVPIGLRLSQAARVVGRAFDEALEAAGGSLPVWLILLNLKIGKPPHQRALAEAVGITDATLTHHLGGLEQRGLITRHRDPGNRRAHVVALTELGEQTFTRLRAAAMAFNARLHEGMSAEEARTLERLLGRLMANVEAAPDTAPPWHGLAEGKQP